MADLSESYAERERFEIDVLVHGDPARIIVAIENKIDSGERSDQLPRYRETIRREYPGHKAVLLFLSPDGQQPSDPEWIPLSYDDVLATTEAVRKARSGIIGGDVLTVAGAATFADKNAGAGKAVSVTTYAASSALHREHSLRASR